MASFDTEHLKMICYGHQKLFILKHPPWNSLRPTFYPVMVLFILPINTIEQNITLKAVEKLHQSQWQFSCYPIWCKVILILLQCNAVR